jgi:hypothetical protein
METGKGHLEAAAAIVVCTTCPVRGRCLALSLRHWEIGQTVSGAARSPANAALRRRRHAKMSACAGGPGHTQARFTVPSRPT